MTIGVYHVGASPIHQALGGALVRSVRRVMRDVPIVHMTDYETVAICGVDDVVRRPVRPIALGCLEHYAWCEGDWLLLDSDVIVQRDVRHVFNDLTFDVAVADRTGTMKAKEILSSFMTRMPYNKGAVFSRSPAFWRAAAEWLASKPEKSQQWMGDQRAMCQVIASGRFHVSVLPNAYNYPPKSSRENIGDKAICHYKGDRKRWMLERAA